jgi:hypothetical protein
MGATLLSFRRGRSNGQKIYIRTYVWARYGRFTDLHGVYGTQERINIYQSKAIPVTGLRGL